MSTLPERFRAATLALTPAQVNDEWAYFQEYARNFEQGEEDPNKKYGILIQGMPTEERNMLYAADPLELRILHLESIAREGGGSVGAKVRHHLDWLERMEGRT
jgi:hypothetical protein